MPIVYSRMFPSLFSAEQNLRSEEVHITEQLQDVEEEKFSFFLQGLLN